MDDLHYWEQNAEIFDSFVGEKGDLLREKILDPFLINQISPNKSDIILDAGTGNGYLARKLAPSVKKVLGIDGSGAMIDIAKKKSEKIDNLQFAKQDLTATPWDFESSIQKSIHEQTQKQIQKGENPQKNSKEKQKQPNMLFSHIIAHLVLQDLDDIDSVLEECYARLKPNGSIHITIPHPFTSPPAGKYHLGIPGKLGFSKGHLKVYNYMEERKTKRSIYLHKQLSHNYYHRKVSTYINTLIKFNFHIHSTQEIGIDEAFADKYPAYSHGHMIPIFLYIKANK